MSEPTAQPAGRVQLVASAAQKPRTGFHATCQEAVCRAGAEAKTSAWCSKQRAAYGSACSTHGVVYGSRALTSTREGRQWFFCVALANTHGAATLPLPVCPTCATAVDCWLLALAPLPLVPAGAFTNQIQKGFEEPRLLIVTDPRTDHQSIKEAAYMNIPVIAFCDTDSDLQVSLGGGGAACCCCCSSGWWWCGSAALDAAAAAVLMAMHRFWGRPGVLKGERRRRIAAACAAAAAAWRRAQWMGFGTVGSSEPAAVCSIAGSDSIAGSEQSTAACRVQGGTPAAAEHACGRTQRGATTNEADSIGLGGCFASACADELGIRCTRQAAMFSPACTKAGA